MRSKYLRGSVWWTDLEKSSVGFTHCTYGQRPVIIISNDMCNTKSQIVNVIPCTTKGDDLDMIHPKFTIEDGVTSYALVEQIRTLDQSKLHHCAGILDDSTMDEIENAMCVQYGMSSNVSNDTSIINALSGINKTLKRIESCRVEQNTIAVERDVKIKSLMDDITKTINDNYGDMSNMESNTTNVEEAEKDNVDIDTPKYSIESKPKTIYAKKPTIYAKSSYSTTYNKPSKPSVKPRKQYTRWTPDMKNDLVRKVEAGDYDAIEKYYSLDRKAAQNYSYKFRKN